MSVRRDPWAIGLLAVLGLLPFVPFTIPIVAGLALAAASLPMQIRLERRMPGWAASSLIAAGWLLLAVLPLVAMVFLLRPALPLVQQAGLNPDGLIAAAGHAPVLGRFVAGHEDTLRAWLLHNQPELVLARHMSELGTVGARVLVLLMRVVLALAVTWTVLASRLSVAEGIQRSLRRLVSADLADRIEHHGLVSTQATIVGMLGLAAWDMVLAIPLYAFAGLSNWFAWAVAMGLLSVVPGGTGVAMVLAAALLGSQGHMAAAFAVLVLGHVITLSGDVFVKPKLIGAASHAPFLIVLLAIFGGVELFGPVGLIAGPVLVLTARAVVFENED